MVPYIQGCCDVLNQWYSPSKFIQNILSLSENGRSEVNMAILRPIISTFGYDEPEIVWTQKDKKLSAAAWTIT